MLPRLSLAVGVISALALGSTGLARFAPPQAPPPMSAIFATLVGHFTADQTALIHFRHREHVVTVKDSQSEGRSFDVWYVHGHQINETIALDNRTLSAAELAAEHTRALERARLAALKPPAPVGVIEFDQQEYPFAQIAGDFVYGAPEVRIWQGRTIWVYPATPNPATQPQTQAEQLLKLSAGEIWVDAADLHVMRISLHMTRPFRYFLGVLGEVHSAGMDLLMARNSEGVWLPVSAEFSLRATVLLLKPLLRSKQQEFSDYQWEIVPVPPPGRVPAPIPPTPPRP